jgi:hypothetical protein
MRKLKLDMDALTVDSFSTSGWSAGAGTVRGRSGALCVEDTGYDTCACGGGGTYTCTCPDRFTCWAGCVHTQPPMASCVENSCNPPATCFGTCVPAECASQATCNPPWCGL